MSEILFKSICFEEKCYNKTVINWHHDNCSSSSNEYLNDNGYIRCSDCGNIWPLLKTKFNCSTQSNINAISNTSLTKALYVISSMLFLRQINENFLWKLSASLQEQNKKLGLEQQ